MLIQSINNLKKTGWRPVGPAERLDHLEKDVAMGQEEATQWVVKKLKEDKHSPSRRKEMRNLSVM